MGFSGYMGFVTFVTAIAAVEPIGGQGVSRFKGIFYGYNLCNPNDKGVVWMGIPKMDYRREVEQILRKYPSYKRSMNVLPACVPSYEERVQGGEQEYISSTEKYAIIRAERKALVGDVELALSFLTPKEKQLIYLTYFQEEKPLINIIWRQLYMSKSTYYRQRDMILDKIASIIVGTFETTVGTFGTNPVLS